MKNKKLKEYFEYCQHYQVKPDKSAKIVFDNENIKRLHLGKLFKKDGLLSIESINLTF